MGDLPGMTPIITPSLSRAGTRPPVSCYQRIDEIFQRNAFGTFAGATHLSPARASRGRADSSSGL